MKNSLSDAIAQFRNNIKPEDYADLGRKGKYLGVPYRLAFVRNFFGQRISIETESFECSDGCFKFKSTICLDGQHIATGESKQTEKKDKEFEKQQTVAIGRGLSFAGFFGDEIATAEEMIQYLKKDIKKTNKPKLTVIESSSNIVDDWIAKMKDVAKYSKSQNDYEKGIMPLREKYQNELHQISNDLVLQQKIDDAESQIKQEITMRYE